MNNTMTYAFAGMFAAFILTSTVIPTWVIIFPLSLAISEIGLANRNQR
ncbi:hypothetical protein [Corynebacterium lizhenjunii]|nr:hypothetical protein [Corynebacterium lizhenjunii]